MSTTREKILQHALERFNRDGVEAVGIREIARELELSPGNLSYHFPKKDDLVAELATQLAAKNASALEQQPTNVAELLESYRVMFRNHDEYRFLVLSIVNLFENNARLAGNYVEREQDRRTQLLAYVRRLAQPGGGLRQHLSDDTAFGIVAHITLVARMWMIEKRISFPDAPLEAAINHYLRLLADAFAPYASEAGTEMLAPYLGAALLT